MKAALRSSSWSAVTQSTKRFAKREEGTIAPFTIVVFFGMLLAGGMGIDFIRFKAEQTRLQDIGDRAVLAAAKIDNKVSPADVVKSYFEASNATDNLVGEPIVQNTGNYKNVTVKSNASVGTFFLPLAGIPTLAGDITSTAVQGMGDIEISLVLDISYSMRGEKIAELRKAALAFAQSALKEELNGGVSLNVIAYAGNVNIGKPMFDYLNTKSILDGADYLDTLIEGAKTPDDTSDDVVYPTHLSYCSDFADSEFKTASLPTSGTQTPHFVGLNQSIKYNAQWWCPLNGGEIRYAQQTAGDVEDPNSLAYFLANLPMGLGTSTHIATKYGLALLDPSSQPAFAHLHGHGLVPDDFVSRPVAYDQPGAQKILVVMTDGAIYNTAAPKNVFDPKNLKKGILNDKKRHTVTKPANQNANTFKSVCDMAKDPSRNIAVYTVAFAANKTAQNQMRDCASSDAFFYNAAASTLTDVFEEIAGQISELRLTN